MRFHSNTSVLEKLAENIGLDLITEIKFIVMMEDDKNSNADKNKKDDTQEMSNLLQIDNKTDTKEADNKDKSIDDNNQESNETNEEQTQTTNDNKQENDLQVKIKWISIQYDKLYNKLYSLVKSKPSINDLFTKFTHLYALLEFFLQNINKYTDDEKTRIYTNFKIAITNINNEIKKIV